MPTPLTQADLAGWTCDDPTCTHEGEAPLYLHARCHVKRPTWVRYLNGELILTCGTCDKEVARFLVAPGPPTQH